MLVVDNFISEKERDLLIDSFSSAIDKYATPNDELGTDSAISLTSFSRGNCSDDPELTDQLLADIEDRFANVIEPWTDGHFGADWLLRMAPGRGLKLHTDTGVRPDKGFVETGVLNLNVGISEYHVEGEIIALGDRSLLFANTSMTHGFDFDALESTDRRRYSLLFREDW